MMKISALFLAVASLCLPTLALADLSQSAENLRTTLRSLGKAVDDQVAKDEGRKDMQRAIDRTRDYLERVRDLSAHGAARGAIAGSLNGAGESFQDAMRQVSNQNSRQIDSLVYQARGQWGAVALEWRGYPPVFIERRPGFSPPPRPRADYSLDGRARDLALRYLESHFLVPPRVAEITRLEQTGDFYRVFVHAPRQGSFVISVNAARGTVISATSGR